MYYYVKNLQGDIVKIINQAGTIYASYVYDAWGNIKNVSGDTTLRELNPFRYRGYVYDSESGLYYLQSRCYDPFTGRFINADDTFYLKNNENILGENIYIYCYNQYIMNTDVSGNKSSSKTVYSRTKALLYAQNNYNNKRDKNGFRYYSRGDCANFVSQCVFSGGIKMNSKWYFGRNPVGRDYYTKTWTSAPDQYKYFKSWGFTKYTISINKKSYDDKSNLKKLITKYNIRGGDLLYMDFDGNGRVDHATMLTGHINRKELLYTAHSNPQYGKKVSSVFNSNKKCIMKIIVLI